MQPQPGKNEDAGRARMFVIERKRADQRFNLEAYLQQQRQDQLELEQEIEVIANKMNLPLPKKVIEKRIERQERELASVEQDVFSLSTPEAKYLKLCKLTLGLSKSETALDQLHLEAVETHQKGLRRSKSFISFADAAEAVNAINTELKLPELQTSQLLKKKSSSAINQHTRRAYYRVLAQFTQLKSIYRIILLFILLVCIGLKFMKNPATLIREMYTRFIGKLPTEPRNNWDYFALWNSILQLNNDHNN